MYLRERLAVCGHEVRAATYSPAQRLAAQSARPPTSKGLDALDDEDPICAVPADHAPRLVPDPDNATEAKLAPRR
jgi:hypothetical protein